MEIRLYFSTTNIQISVCITDVRDSDSREFLSQIEEYGYDGTDWHILFLIGQPELWDSLVVMESLCADRRMVKVAPMSPV